MLTSNIYLPTSISSALHHALTRQGTECLRGTARVDRATPHPQQGSLPNHTAMAAMWCRNPHCLWGWHVSSIPDLPLSPESLPRSRVVQADCGTSSAGLFEKAPGTTVVPFTLPWSRGRDWTSSQGPNQPCWAILFHPLRAQAVKGNNVVFQVICLRDVAESGLKLFWVLAQSLNQHWSWILPFSHQSLSIGKGTAPFPAKLWSQGVLRTKLLTRTQGMILYWVSLHWFTRRGVKASSTLNNGIKWAPLHSSEGLAAMPELATNERRLECQAAAPWWFREPQSRQTHRKALLAFIKRHPNPF